MNKTKQNSIAIIVIGTLLVIVIISFFKEADKTLPNYTTVIGTVVSIVGLVIAFLNILALKEMSVQNSLKIEASIQKVSQINAVSEISKAIKMNQEIQHFIRSGKVELAQLRTSDLKYMLHSFNSNENLSNLTKNSKYKKLIIDFGIDLNSINESLINPSRKIDSTKLIQNLEELSTFLAQFENKLKSLRI